jgi:hypothetical protein
LPGATLTERIGNVYIALPTFPFSLIAEGYVVSHAGPSRSYETIGGFVTASYAFAPFTPYVRFESLVMLADDPFFLPTPGVGLSKADFVVHEGVIGTRWDMSPWATLKAEYRLDYSPILERIGHQAIASWQFAL